MLCDKSLVIITGANRGYGLQLAKDISLCLGDCSCLILVARSDESLQKAVCDVKENIKSDITVTGVLCDLSVTDQVEGLMDKCINSLKDHELSNFASFYLFHNAGSVGDVSKPLANTDNTAELINYFNLNLVGVQVLTSKFLQKLDGKHHCCCIVNISSLCAIKPFPWHGTLLHRESCQRYVLSGVGC